MFAIKKREMWSHMCEKININLWCGEYSFLVNDNKCAVRHWSSGSIKKFHISCSAELNQQICLYFQGNSKIARLSSHHGIWMSLRYHTICLFKYFSLHVQRT